MGWLSKLISPIVKIGRGLLGLPPAAPAATVAPVARTIGTLGPLAIGAAAGTTVGNIISRGAGIIGTSLAPGAALSLAGKQLAARQAATAAGGGAAPLTVMGGAMGGGNGQFVKQTVVQTILIATGEVTRQEVFQGAPFLMAKDVTKLRSTAKKLSRAAGRLPRKTVAESKTKQLTNAVLDTAMRGLATGAVCPPKC